MADSRDARRTAALVFQRMTRRGMISADRTVVCLESDSLGRVLETMANDFPEGGHLAVYFPAEQAFRLMTWKSDDPTAPEGIKAHTSTTAGMAISAAIAANDDTWVDRGRQKISTTAIERELASA